MATIADQPEVTSNTLVPRCQSHAGLCGVFAATGIQAQPRVPSDGGELWDVPPLLRRCQDSHVWPDHLRRGTSAQEQGHQDQLGTLSATALFNSVSYVARDHTATTDILLMIVRRLLLIPWVWLFHGETKSQKNRNEGDDFEIDGDEGDADDDGDGDCNNALWWWQWWWWW